MRVERGMFHKTALIIKLIACKGIEYLNVYRLSDEVNFEPAFWKFELDEKNTGEEKVYRQNLANVRKYLYRAVVITWALLEWKVIMERMGNSESGDHEKRMRLKCCIHSTSSCVEL